MADNNYTESWGSSGGQQNGQPAGPQNGQTGQFNAPYNPPVQMGVPAGYTQKNKTVAGILGILLGGLGVHNFYIGNTKRGLIQLLVSLCTCGIGALPMEIWGLIEGIQILTNNNAVDANGVPMSS